MFIKTKIKLDKDLKKPIRGVNKELSLILQSAKQIMRNANRRFVSDKEYKFSWSIAILIAAGKKLDCKVLDEVKLKRKGFLTRCVNLFKN